MTYSLSDLNQCDQTAFIRILGGIFEDSPWITEQTWQKLFNSVDSREREKEISSSYYNNHNASRAEWRNEDRLLRLKWLHALIKL